MAALRDPMVFSSKMGFRVIENSEEVDRILEEGGYGDQVDTLVTNDPPSHTRYRQYVNRAFTVQRVSGMEPYIQKIISDTFADIGDKNHMEVVTEFAIPIPMKIIADQLGVSRDDMGKFKEWSDGAVEPLGGLITPERHIEVTKLMVEFQHYFVDRIKERQDAKEGVYDDMLNDLVQARVEGEEPLDYRELLSILLQLLVAGNETTTNTIASGVLLLCRNPALLNEIYEDDSKAEKFAEEVLRLESPVQGLFRMTTQDTELGGVKIPEGSMLNLRYASANRDEKIFPDSENMDLSRKGIRRHLAFGSGIHSCIGSQLARKELEYTFSFLAKQLSHIELDPQDQPVEYHPSLILRGIKKLDVSFVRRKADK
jgi:cytochrome P450